jgi:hypothetical protein
MKQKNAVCSFSKIVSCLQVLSKNLIIALIDRKPPSYYHVYVAAPKAFAFGMPKFRNTNGVRM